MDNRLTELAETVIQGRRNEAVEMAQRLLESGVGPEQILNEGLIAAMSNVGEQFKRCEIYVPEMLMAARAMKASIEILRPALKSSGIEPIGTMVIGTVRGDLHDIGKNLVIIMAEGTGFRVIDLGVDVSPEKFVEAVREHSPTIVAMSALLTTTMTRMPEVVQALKESNLRDQVKVIVGGAAVTQEWASEIGADAYAPDAATAAERCKELLGKAA